MEPTSAEGWAKLAAGFCEGEVKFCKGSNGWPELLFAPGRPFDPLHDLNDLGLVKAEIRRRELWWGLELNDRGYTCSILDWDSMVDKRWRGNGPTENLAVLRAAFVLGEEKP